PLLDVSLGNFSFSSSSARSLQAMLNVQMINAVLAKIKYSIQRMLLYHGLSQSDARGYIHGPYYSHLGRHHSYPTPPDLASPSSIANGTGSPSPFVSGVDNVVRRALLEIQDLELSLRIRARAIQQWSEE
ncbi:hypothetical protein BO71DRAFT_282112, partial [Aspergillus ellipticus CBS 707.79]